MIDHLFIMKYTEALYSTPSEFSPRYDEFRDMFSGGQIRSKLWVLNQLENLPLTNNKKFVIVGDWFGTLGLMIKQRFPLIDLTMLDIDTRCEKFVNNVTHSSIKYLTEDMYKHQYTEDIIINTSCEHIPNIRNWLDIIPKGKTVILQSNNYFEGNGHINCVNSIEEFIHQTRLTDIKFSGKLELPIYTRFMIVAKT